MHILQLCCRSNLWPKSVNVTSIDLLLHTSIFDVDFSSLQQYTAIVAAPPCTQFTKANNNHWLDFPITESMVALHCLKLCLYSNKPFIIENPPGRLPGLLPSYEKYRVLTYRCTSSNKEYVLYSNLLLPGHHIARYGRSCIPRNKSLRELWPQELVNYMYNVFSCL